MVWWSTVRYLSAKSGSQKHAKKLQRKIKNTDTMTEKHYKYWTALQNSLIQDYKQKKELNVLKNRPSSSSRSSAGKSEPINSSATSEKDRKF
jgi:hypothetical protein